jgi:ABC-2 type transport system ATP-binding protein
VVISQPEKLWVQRLAFDVSGSEVPMGHVIEVHNLRKTYGDVVAVDGISFEVAAGEIFGMVGPNGAGKTTTIECIEGLRRPDDGSVRLLGLDPLAEREAIAQRIGVQLQECTLPSRLRAGEALALFGSFYRRQADAEELLELLGLAEKRTSAFSKLSGGQKQRLFIALALVNQPEVVFFDELTTGLDPQARRAMWDLVRQVRDRGCTVVLTTHFMEEAERLCDRVAIVDHGRLVALDTPDALIRSLGAEKRLVFTLPEAPLGQEAQQLPALANLMQVTRVERSNNHLAVYGHGERFVSSVVYALEDGGMPFLDLRTEQPNLEDVFLALTGREMRE